MLIKDPYLGSQIKNRSFSTLQPKNVNVGQFNEQSKGAQYMSQPFKKKEDKNINKVYERQIRSLSQAYRNQEQVFKKMASLQYVNKQYSEAMKQRNYQLNAKLNDLTYQKSLIAQRHQQQALKNTYDKDLLLKKYEQQNDEILKLKRSNSQLLQQKARLQSQIDHLMFLMEKDNHQGSLEIKQQIIRMENMQKTLRGIIDTKDAQIIQLRHRIKIYQDQNKRLNDLNRTLTITRQQKIDNLSHIQHMESITKSHNKQNIDMNRRDDFLISQLNQQKQMNKQLLAEITLMKKKLFEQPQKKVQKRQHIQNLSDKQITQKIQTLSEIRKRINSHVYQIYCKSIRQGQKQKRNSLLLFIQNYKKSTIKSQLPLIKDYMSMRQQVKNQYKSIKNLQIRERIEYQLPMKLNTRQHNKDNQWVLSTMQLTKNQRHQKEQLKQKPSSTDKYKDKQPNENNNAILFLFRLLTIQYRVKNPTQGKNIKLDIDVQNQLLHSIVKATQSLIQLT